MDLEQLVRRQFELSDRHEVDAFLEAFDPDCEWIAPGATARGREAIRQYLAPYHAAFPNGRHELDVTVVGDTAFVEGVWTATHDGVLATPQGDVPPTGRPVREGFAGVIQTRDGRIVSTRFYFDQLDMMQQLGLVPEPAAA